MTRNIKVSTVLLAIVLFFTGCGKHVAQSAGPQKTQLPQTEPTALQSPANEPEKAVPLATEPCASETVRPEPAQTEKLSTPDVNLRILKPQIRSADIFSGKYAEMLKTCVDDKGMVNYKMLKKQKLELIKMLDDLRSLDPNEYKRWSKEDKIAFWINAYNLQMLRIITDNYPIESTRMLRLIWPPDSIRHITGIWDEYKFIVMDEEFTLAEIDHQFFREEFDEPRVFLALTYASLSSPPLRNEPYSGNSLYQQLDDQAKKFLSNPLAFKIDRETQKVYLSAIFESSWYGQYFVNKYGTDKKFKDHPAVARAVLNFTTSHIPEPDVRYLETGNYSIEYIRFNWRLNE